MSLTVHVTVPRNLTPVFLFTPAPVRWKLSAFVLSLIVILYVPAVTTLAFAPAEVFSEIVLPGPTVPLSFGVTGITPDVNVLCIGSDGRRTASGTSCSERHVPRFVADEDDVRGLVDTRAEQVEVVIGGLVVDEDRVGAGIEVGHGGPTRVRETDRRAGTDSPDEARAGGLARTGEDDGGREQRESEETAEVQERHPFFE